MNQRPDFERITLLLQGGGALRDTIGARHDQSRLVVHHAGSVEAWVLRL